MFGFLLDLADASIDMLDKVLEPPGPTPAANATAAKLVAALRRRGATKIDVTADGMGGIRLRVNGRLVVVRSNGRVDERP